MYQEWPLGRVPKELERPELNMLRSRGYHFNDPMDVVNIFEQKIAEFSGAPYAIAIDSCSNGLFLALKYLNASGTITIPAHTYASVPMQIHHAGCKIKMVDEDWQGAYQLKPYPVWDSAIQWRRNMYAGGLRVVSFQIKKAIPIGRGGAILTDDINAYKWLKKARHDGRNTSIPYLFDDFEFIGWHMYMTPEDAARGILLMDARSQDWPDRSGKDSYSDLSKKTIFKNAQR